MAESFTPPKYDYRKYARMSSIRYGTLLNIVSSYTAELEYLCNKKKFSSLNEYLNYQSNHYEYLKEIIDVNIEDKAISSNLDTAYLPFTEDDIPFIDEIDTPFASDDSDEDSDSSENRLEDPDEFVDLDVLMASLPEEAESTLDPVLECKVTVSSFVEWAVRMHVPIPHVFIEFNRPDLLHKHIDSDQLLKLHKKNSKDISALEKENTKVTEGLLKMVIAMAIKGYNYKPDEKGGAVMEIVADLESLDVPVSATTIRTRLKEAAALLPQQGTDKAQ